jgi:tetratricopeptide (TPR) repeat protein
MTHDPGNIVVKLCAEGMAKEAKGLMEEAERCFRRAWDAADDDFEAFTAAHFLARHQDGPTARLRWNLEALTRADRIADRALDIHLPSLHLNVAKCHEELGDLRSAVRHYSIAAEKSGVLGNGGYADMVRSGIAAGLKRSSNRAAGHARLEELIARWCARRDLKPLSLVLPAFAGDGATDPARLGDALRCLHASGCLDGTEQRMLEEAMGTMERRNP